MRFKTATVHLRDNETGKTKRVKVEHVFDEGHFINEWGSRNHVCDCNRGLLFHGWDDVPEDWGCGHSRYSVVKATMNRKVFFTEEDDNRLRASYAQRVKASNLVGDAVE